MTLAVEQPEVRAVAPSPARGLPPAWAPPAALAVLTTAALAYYRVPVPTTATFAAYVALGIVLPGTLIWRAVRGRSGWLVEDLAAGLTVGYAGEVLAYIACRALGVPAATVAWAAGTVAVFLAVPRLRRHWRGGGEPADRTPRWWSLGMTAVGAVVVGWSCLRFYRVHDLVEPGMLGPDPDSPFHLALLGEAKHHVPLMSPWVADQPVLYHWFVYAEMAATSWTTGIEPHTLLVRLAPLPMLLGFLTLVGVLGRRLTGTWWAGLAAPVLTLFVLAPSPYRWPLSQWFADYNTNPYEDGSSLRVQLWTSPTQTFGACLVAGLVLVVAAAMTEGGRARWALAALLTAAVTGAKATYAPMLLAGLLLVVAARLVTRRRVPAGLLFGCGLAVAAVLFAQFVLFGGASQGMSVDPLHFTEVSGAAYTTRFQSPQSPQLWRAVFTALVTLACWACIWPGLLGLARLVRHRRPDVRVAVEPAILCLGIGLSGVAALAVLGNQDGAEDWFMVSARPYLSLAAVAGLALIAPRRITWAAGAALGAGGLVLLGVRALTPATVPRLTGLGGPRAAWQLAWPYLLAFGLLAVVFLVVYRLSRADRRTLACALLAGAGLATSAVHLAAAVRQADATGYREVARPPALFAPGTAQAGRWLRDHSSPADLVATNAHCLPFNQNLGCDNRHFAFAAFTERRFLVESWGFTDRNHTDANRLGVNPIVAPYWDPARLAANDAAFARPSAATVGRLRDEYHVRWLFVAESTGEPGPDLARFATLRYRAGQIAVYEIER
ncbi:hypothetical protein [Dactylosporangium sp. CS-033363]|uniref:hypothetical protein n=1 Tax=Dactylosporangium sp. CS-033363 TaxID=3239935 RepID=UPI003D8A1116